MIEISELLGIAILYLFLVLFLSIVATAFSVPLDDDNEINFADYIKIFGVAMLFVFVLLGGGFLIAKYFFI